MYVCMHNATSNSLITSHRLFRNLECSAFMIIPIDRYFQVSSPKASDDKHYLIRVQPPQSPLETPMFFAYQIWVGSEPERSVSCGPADLRRGVCPVVWARQRPVTQTPERTESQTLGGGTGMSSQGRTSAGIGNAYEDLEAALFGCRSQFLSFEFEQFRPLVAATRCRCESQHQPPRSFPRYHDPFLNKPR
jgi:hypothetical protein